MKITFTRKKKKAEVPVFGASAVKLYTVDTAYSADGYFAAVWATGELEPVPACSQGVAELLAHVTLAHGEDGKLEPTPIFCQEGVTYALD